MNRLVGTLSLWLLCGTAAACPPPRPGGAGLPAWQQTAKSAIEGSTSIVIAKVVSESQVSDFTRGANLSVKEVLKGNPISSVEYNSSSCGNPFGLGGFLGDDRYVLIVVQDKTVLFSGPLKAGQEKEGVEKIFMESVGWSPYSPKTH